MPHTDVLVIGSGIAGLSFALKCATESPDRTVTILTKCDASESNTKYAQGGMAVVLDQKLDSYDQHIQDTLAAGAGHCDEAVVRLVVEEGPKRLLDMVGWGANFDKDHGKMKLGREGGHSVNRIVHNRDMTGYEMEKALLSRIGELKNVRLLPHQFAVKLLINDANSCTGAQVIDKKNDAVLEYHAAVTIVSSGGMGRVYGITTNPEIATGDGIAMVSEAGAVVRDMEFIQFHPTALYNPDKGPTFLISEAVRGDGAILTDADGNRFMGKYHPSADLAPRDVVSKAIWEELQHSGRDHVFLDCTGIESTAFLNHFPTILARCMQSGIDPLKVPIPVAPAAHYLCGGIATDQHGATSIQNLYAIGECARTGLHGANRLASNSLLEALVFAHRAALQVSEFLTHQQQSMSSAETEARRTDKLTVAQTASLKQMKLDLQLMMADKVGIVRTDKGLAEAKSYIDDKLRLLNNELGVETINLQLLEVRNLHLVARLIVDQSLTRKSNMGGHYNKDREDSSAIA